jgi:SAM-dependent MidA family methyltransferase
MTWKPWREAWDNALYGEAGFYRRQGGPAQHFRTSVHASPLFARAVHTLAERIDAALGHPPIFDIVDLGAGRGELLAAMPPSRFRLTGVDLIQRPAELPAEIRWRHEPPAHITGLLIAHEWLDNVPAEVVECDEDGAVRHVEVDVQTGEERLGGQVRDNRVEDWLERWWALRPGERAEVGRSRDDAWRQAVSTVDRGLALAVDYGHVSASRPSSGSFAAFAHGRQVTPVPDGSCDLTAHVAFDSLATPDSLITDQRTVLTSLGLSGRRPDRGVAVSDPAAYLRLLSDAAAVAELSDPGGLGEFLWLFEPRGMDGLPIAVAGSTAQEDINARDIGRQL